MSDHKVSLPFGKSGDVELRPIEVRNDVAHMREKIRGRGSRLGTYTGLYRGGQLWMSDTDAEWNDNLGAVWAMQRYGGRVLIGGLGLGMIVKAALAMPNVEHVDVIELDPDVIALVGPTYAGDRCTIIQADLLTHKWPPNTRWTVAWFDIWPNICEDYLPEMAKLKRSYGRRVQWQGCWGQELAQQERRRTAGAFWR